MTQDRITQIVNNANFCEINNLLTYPSGKGAVMRCLY